MVIYSTMERKGEDMSLRPATAQVPTLIDLKATFVPWRQIYIATRKFRGHL